MASLTEVFEGHVRTVTTPRRLHIGASLFAVGTAMVVGAIAVATTGVGEQVGLGQIAARQLAGVLAGLGLPAAFLGVFTVLPSGPNTRAAALIGASVSVLGVALFAVAYPAQWFGAGHPLAVMTVLVYFSGAVTTLACMFAALATFQTRNDPGGTARMEITEEGRVRLVEGADIGPVPGTPGSAAGSVGLFGDGPDGSVQTQTNRDSPSGPEDGEDDDAEILTERSQSQERNRNPGRAYSGHPATADGGSAAVDDSGSEAFSDAEFLDAARERGRPDAYCGNCDYFEYVKVEGNITPYCTLQGDLMDDMDACTEWTEAN